MKLPSRILLATLAAAIALPGAAFAAKGERKKGTPPPVADFASIDKDGNGSISQAEYVAAMKDKQGGEEGAKTQFAALDKDKDGKLSKDELAGASGEKKGRKKKNRN